MKISLILLSFIKIQEGGLNFAIFLDQLSWNDLGVSVTHA